MARFKQCLAVKVEEDERRERQDVSLKDQFEEDVAPVVYIESWPEKTFRAALFILLIFFVLIGIMVLIMSDTRALLVGIIMKFFEEMLSTVQLG